ncbi:MAG TPA: flagellar hook protein FlgE [Chloroflexota bacterium]|nr:flagellar hook protein FlgE [Chloroflexota bacterium]
MNGLSSLSASGLQASMHAFDRSAAGASRAAAQSSNDLPDAANGGPDLLDSVVGMRVAASDVKANLAVMRTADEMLGTLLDMKA